MTKYESDQWGRAQRRDGWSCVICGSKQIERGHVIPQRVNWLALLGAAIIHHAANVKSTCQVCNAKVQVNPNSVLDVRQQVTIILEAIREESGEELYLRLARAIAENPKAKVYLAPGHLVEACA